MTTWVYLPFNEVSLGHCGQPAYWEGDLVFCSKCQEQLPENDNAMLADGFAYAPCANKCGNNFASGEMCSICEEVTQS